MSNFTKPNFLNDIVAMSSDETKFRYWVQKVLPLVYDDSLSYYELLSKVIVTLNNVIENNNKMAQNIEKLIKAYNDLENWVSDTYYEELNNVIKRLDEMDKYFGIVLTYKGKGEQNTSVYTMNHTGAEIVNAIKAGNIVRIQSNSDRPEGEKSLAGALLSSIAGSLDTPLLKFFTFASTPTDDVASSEGVGIADTLCMCYIRGDEMHVMNRKIASVDELESVASKVDELESLYNRVNVLEGVAKKVDDMNKYFGIVLTYNGKGEQNTSVYTMNHTGAEIVDAIKAGNIVRIQSNTDRPEGEVSLAGALLSSIAGSLDSPLLKFFTFAPTPTDDVASSDGVTIADTLCMCYIRGDEMHVMQRKIVNADEVEELTNNVTAINNRVAGLEGEIRTKVIGTTMTRAESGGVVFKASESFGTIYNLLLNNVNVLLQVGEYPALKCCGATQAKLEFMSTVSQYEDNEFALNIVSAFILTNGTGFMISTNLV